jgi:hypothetical protein
LAVGLVVSAVIERRPSLLLAAPLPLVGAVIGSRADNWVGTRWIGESRNASMPSVGGDLPLLSARLESLWSSTLQPSEIVDTISLGALSLLVGVVIGAIAVMRYRTRREPSELVALLSVATVLVVVHALLLREPPNLVPGLFTASPLLLWGLLALRRDEIRSAPATLVVVSSAVYIASVIATQYSTGGGLVWGARYLQLALPMIVPIVAIATVDLARSVPTARRRQVVCLLAISTIVMTTSGIVAQREGRQRTADQLASAQDAAATTDSGIIISTFPSLPRSATDQFARGQRWLWVWPDGLGELLSAVERREGPALDDAILVTHDVATTDRELAAIGWTRGESTTVPGNPEEWTIMTVSRQDPE